MKIDLNLTPGKSGAWEVKQFAVNEAEARFDAVWQIISGHRRKAIVAGTYWMLTEKGNIYMSNTPAEVSDHWRFICEAHGKVLIAGLGLGMVVQALLNKGGCDKIVVVEKSEDVIRLVGPAYDYHNVEIVHSDIFDYKPTEHFDYAWFDIWPEIDGDRYPEMKRLHRKFARSVTVKESWCRELFKESYYA